MKDGKTIYSGRATAHSLSDWYGQDATDAIMRVTDAIAPFMRSQEAFKKFFYVHEWVRENQSGEVSVHRVATNRIAGCPEFVQTKRQNFIPNDNPTLPGFIDFTLPESVLSLVSEWTKADIASAESKKQPVQAYYANRKGFQSDKPVSRKILAALALPEREIEELFGATAMQIGSMITGLLKEEVMYYAPAKYMDFYHTYYVQETHMNGEVESVYEGFIYSNLLSGCPTFYPTKDGSRRLKQKQDRLAANGGKMDIVLPERVLKEVRKIKHEYENATIL